MSLVRRIHLCGPDLSLGRSLSCHQPSADSAAAVFPAGGMGVRDPANTGPFPGIDSLCSGIITWPGDDRRFCSEPLIHHNECH